MREVCKSLKWFRPQQIQSRICLVSPALQKLLLKIIPRGPEQHRKTRFVLYAICAYSANDVLIISSRSVFHQKLDCILEEMVDFTTFSKTLYENEALAIVTWRWCGNRQQFLRVIMRMIKTGFTSRKRDSSIFSDKWRIKESRKPLAVSFLFPICLGRSRETLLAGYLV